MCVCSRQPFSHGCGISENCVHNVWLALCTFYSNCAGTMYTGAAVETHKYFRRVYVVTVNWYIFTQVRIPSKMLFVHISPCHIPWHHNSLTWNFTVCDSHISYYLPYGVHTHAGTKRKDEILKYESSWQIDSHIALVCRPYRRFHSIYSITICVKIKCRGRYRLKLFGRITVNSSEILNCGGMYIQQHKDIGTDWKLKLNKFNRVTFFSGLPLIQ